MKLLVATISYFGTGRNDIFALMLLYIDCSGMYQWILFSNNDMLMFITIEHQIARLDWLGPLCHRVPIYLSRNHQICIVIFLNCQKL